MERQCVSNWLFVQAMTEGSLLDYHYYGSLIIFCLHGNVVIVVIFWPWFAQLVRLICEHLQTWTFSMWEAVDAQRRENIVRWPLILAARIRSQSFADWRPYTDSLGSQPRHRGSRWIQIQDDWLNQWGEREEGRVAAIALRSCQCSHQGLSLLVTRFPSPNPITVYCFCEISNSMPADLVEGKSIGEGIYKER